MTGYKTILACLTDVDTTPATLALAFLIAQDQSAHVEALHVRNDPASAIPLIGEGMSTTMVEEMLAVAERQGQERATYIRDCFNEACLDAGMKVIAASAGVQTPSASWREEIGLEEDVLASLGRLSDLLVIARPLPDSDSPSIMTINAALMETGRPVLLAPPTMGRTAGRNVVVFWNGSPEASRAVSFAMPILQHADTVAVLSAREENNVVPADLANYLKWHGINASIHIFAGGSQVGAPLMAEATKMGADLVVMGAYTHSRLHRLIMGGVTRHVLHCATLPVLFCH
jgi:nucleotide-binding universal stress UspA family protein